MRLEENDGILTERSRQKLKPLLDYFEVHDSITPKEAEQVIKKSKSTTYRYLTILMNAGIITPEGKTSNVVYKKTESYEMYN